MVVQNASLKRLQQQQQRVSRLALVSAVASFLIGIMLPWNLRAGREVDTQSVPRSLPEVAAPAVESPEEAEKNPSPEATPGLPEDSSPPLPEGEYQEEPRAFNLPAMPDSAMNPKELPSVGIAIAQRVEGVQLAVNRLKAQRFENTIPDRFKGKTVKSVDLGSEEKVIALTFDDGPWPTTTEEILDILRENNIKATFFWVGRALYNFKEIGQKVAADGHVIANHTWNHLYHYHNRAAAAKEIEDTAKLIEEVVGIKTTIFRPPGGVQDNGLVDYAFSEDYVNIMWSSDSRDWRSSASSIKNNVIGSAKSGHIILLHDGGGDRSQTVKALPEIIAELKKQGYRFVTIPELLEMGDRHIARTEGELQQQSGSGTYSVSSAGN